MRYDCIALVSVAISGVVGHPRAETQVSGAVGGGAFAGRGYAAADLRLDVEWSQLQIGLGTRIEMREGRWRAAEWQRGADLIRVVRFVQWQHKWDTGQVVTAGGALGPLSIANIVSEYRTSIDLQRRVGAHAQLSFDALHLTAAIDDVNDPAVIATSLRFDMSRHWRATVAAAIDPSAEIVGTNMSEMSEISSQATIIALSQASFEFGVQRDWATYNSASTSIARIEAGATIEPGVGLFAFGQAAATLHSGQWAAAASVGADAGTGTVGSAFGPLYRLDRVSADAREGVWQLAKRGALNGISVGSSVMVTRRDLGWISLSIKRRAGLGTLGTASVTLPMSKRWQAAGWLAANQRTWASAAELRVTWPDSSWAARSK